MSVRRGMPKLASAVLLVALLAVLVVAAPAPAPGDAIQKGGKLIYAFSEHPRRESLDPQNMTGLPALVIADALFDRLVDWSPKAGQYVPWLAKSWKVSSDQREITFVLRQDVKFHDGTRFDAHAAKWNFDRGMGELYTGNMFYNETRLVQKAEVVDDFTFKIVLRQPSPDIWGSIARPMWGFVSPTAVQKLGPEKFQLNPVGTGPFMLKEWISRQRVVLVRNPNYNWPSEGMKRTGPAYLDEVEFRFVLEAATRSAALESGQLNAIEMPLEGDIPRFRKDSRLAVVSITKQGGPGTFEINVTNPPTDELAVRRAVVHGINVVTLVKTAYFGLHKSAFGVVSPGLAGGRIYDTTSERFYRYDPDFAKQLLDEAGWKVGAGGIREKQGRRLRLVMVTSTDLRAEEFAQGQLREIGIEMVIRQLDSAGEAAAWRDARGYNLARGLGGERGTLAFSGDILRILFSCSLVGIRNMSRWCNERTEVLLRDALVQEDPERGTAMYKEVQRILAENAAWRPILNPARTIATSAKVKGLWIEPDNGWWIRLYNAHFVK